MIITLIAIGIVVVGIVLLIISNNKKLAWSTRDNMTFWGTILVAISGFVSIILLSIVGSNVASMELDYQNTLHEKEMIEYRIEHIEDNIAGNEMIYNDIVELNNKLRFEKKWANNPWTSWFNNKYIASIDYVGLNDK